MASFKALCFAGVASLAATACAHAADLPLPPPPPLIAPPAPVVVGGAWYLRGDVGVGISDLRTRTSTFDNPYNQPPDVRYESQDFDDTAFIDGGVGYRFNQYFRVDATGTYHGNSHFNTIESYNQGYFNNPPDASRGYDFYSGSIRTVTGLVNGYVSPGTFYGFSPFVGAGVGVADVKVGTINDSNLGFSQPHSQTNFAFALMAGLDFAVTPNLALELGYRYLDAGRVRSGTIQCLGQDNCPNEVQHFHVAYNDVRLGFRYTFADFVAPRYPIIAKY